MPGNQEPRLFKQVHYSLHKLIRYIETGEIGLPDIQRPFVWKNGKVRDLFDSLYKGFPAGCLLFWSIEDNVNDVIQIGKKKEKAVPRFLIVDGQQRLTSLYAVLKNAPVKDSDYKDKYISIAFRPRDGKFEVTNAIIEKNPEFITNISELWSGHINKSTFVIQYLEKLKAHNIILAENDKESLSKSIDRLYNLPNYSFTVLELHSSVDESLVADIFVRVNSQNVVLNKADFILTLMSVFWEKGRSDLEKFCYIAKQPLPIRDISPFNYFIKPEPDDILGVSIALGFRRVGLQFAYSLLRGKDFDTSEFVEEKKKENFGILEYAQSYVLDLSNWHEFLKILFQAGFRSESMIASKMAIIYSYALFLIGKRDFNVEPMRLRNIIARWFFFISLTGRYTVLPEEAMESDLTKLKRKNSENEFLETLEQIMKNVLTEHFWKINLPHYLDTSDGRSPVLYAYFASLNILDAYVLFSTMKVSELLDPAIKYNKPSLERYHHNLFPKRYLEKIGITDIKEINKIANFALLEWSDNMNISDLPPDAYFPKYEQRLSKEMRYWYALPEGWEKLHYKVFLQKRKSAIAKVIQDGYEHLTKGGIVYKDESLFLVDVIKHGESDTSEFKSSLIWDYEKNQPTTEFFIPFSIIKTIAAFLNSAGGKLLVGVDDKGNILGIENDFNVFETIKNWNDWSQHLLNLVKRHLDSEIMELLSLESQIHDKKTVAILDVKMSPRPVFVEYKDKKGAERTDFFIRALNTTQRLNVKQATDYISLHWN